MDRNKAIILADGLRCESLSARRAWIEIKVPEDQYTALSSLSARRAWIEIPGGVCRSLGPGRRSPQGERG